MKKTALLLLLATCFIQWLVPAKMIWENERLYSTGTTFKIRTIPVDPNDPFRGKYITLSYDINTYYLEKFAYKNEFSNKDKVFVLVEEDENGFAKIVSISKTPPSSNDYLTANIRSVHETDTQYIFRLDYPFQKFFMEETKAPKAEELYWEALRHTDKQVYGLVNIKAGKAVLKDVQVDGVSIVELVQ